MTKVLLDQLVLSRMERLRSSSSSVTTLEE